MQSTKSKQEGEGVMYRQRHSRLAEQIGSYVEHLEGLKLACSPKRDEPKTIFQNGCLQ